MCSQIKGILGFYYAKIKSTYEVDRQEPNNATQYVKENAVYRILTMLVTLAQVRRALLMMVFSLVCSRLSFKMTQKFFDLSKPRELEVIMRLLQEDVGENDPVVNEDLGEENESQDEVEERKTIQKRNRCRGKQKLIRTRNEIQLLRGKT